MEEARKKLRVCLICIVLLAIVVGLIYYAGVVGKETEVSDGTLVRTEHITDTKWCMPAKQVGLFYE